MRAITVIPGRSASWSLTEIAEPQADEGEVLVETLAVGLCGTDVEIVSGAYGALPPESDRLVLGHESLGRVLEAPAGSGFAAGDLAVAIVRRPDPVPCYACAAGEWDSCRNGRYTEHGIKELDGFMRERYRTSPEGLVALDASLGDLGVLLEPTTVVAKAWEQIEATGHRSLWEPTRCLVVGAGPIGLLGALLAHQRGFEVTVVDQMTSGYKPDVVRALGAHYHHGSLEELRQAPDVVLECTGVPSLVLASIAASAPGGVVCLTGISPTGQNTTADFGSICREMVLRNTVVVGSVNANRSHYEAGATALAAAPPDWLARLITRRVPMEHLDVALQRDPHDVKVVVEVAS
jgi:threonine dehydrogenase-like Zn-dependent dehydrogenase